MKWILAIMMSVVFIGCNKDNSGGNGGRTPNGEKPISTVDIQLGDEIDESAMNEECLKITSDLVTAQKIPGVLNADYIFYSKQQVNGAVYSTMDMREKFTQSSGAAVFSRSIDINDLKNNRNARVDLVRSDCGYRPMSNVPRAWYTCKKTEFTTLPPSWTMSEYYDFIEELCKGDPKYKRNSVLHGKKLYRARLKLVQGWVDGWLEVQGDQEKVECNGKNYDTLEIRHNFFAEASYNIIPAFNTYCGRTEILDHMSNYLVDENYRLDPEDIKSPDTVPGFSRVSGLGAFPH